MRNKKIQDKAEELKKKYKILLQRKTLELLLHDMVGVQGIEETRNILKWWHDRLDEF
jgi:hypothetical protein